MSYYNKFDLRKYYKYRIDLEDNPLYSFNQFNLNSVLYIINQFMIKYFRKQKNPTTSKIEKNIKWMEIYTTSN